MGCGASKTNIAKESTQKGSPKLECVPQEPVKKVKEELLSKVRQNILGYSFCVTHVQRVPVLLHKNFQKVQHCLQMKQSPLNAWPHCQ